MLLELSLKLLWRSNNSSHHVIVLMYEQEQRIILHKPAGQRDRQLGTLSSVLLVGRASITTSATSAGTPVMCRKKPAREMMAFIMDSQAWCLPGRSRERAEYSSEEA